MCRTRYIPCAAAWNPVEGPARFRGVRALKIRCGMQATPLRVAAVNEAGSLDGASLWMRCTLTRIGEHSARGGTPIGTITIPTWIMARRVEGHVPVSPAMRQRNAQLVVH